MTAEEWLEQFAAAIGGRTPTADELDALLALAGIAAHGSERRAAPVACWIAAGAGVSPADALAAARRLSPEGQG